jgi:hypothetical protein
MNAIPQLRLQYLEIDNVVVDLQHSIDWFHEMWQGGMIPTSEFIIIRMIFERLMTDVNSRAQVLEENPLMPDIGSTPGDYTEMLQWLVDYGDLEGEPLVYLPDNEYITDDLVPVGDWMTPQEVEELMDQPIHEWDLGFEEEHKQ